MERVKNVWGVLVLLVSVLMSVSGVLAVDVSGCDFVIDGPGEYVVTGDILAGSGDCIVINSSDVALDCAGFVLDGNWVVDASGIRIYDVENVSVRGCEVLEFDAYGVVLENVNDSVFEDLVLDGNGIDVVNEMFDEGGLSLLGSNSNVFENIVVMNDWWDNLYLYESSGNTFLDSLFDYAYNEGVELQLSDDNVFDNVTISSPYYDGFYVANSDRTTIKNSFVSGADDGAEGFGVGIFIDGSDYSLIYNNVFDNSMNVDVSLAGVGNSWNSSVGNYWYGFSDTASCVDSDDNGICDSPYDFSDGVTAIDYFPFDNLELWSFIRSIDIEFNDSEWNATSTNFSDFSDEELANLSGVIFINDYGSISFLDNISILGDMILDGNIIVSDNLIFVNSSALPEFNSVAELTLRGLGFTVPRILRDGVVCDDCAIVGYSNGTLVFNVSGFSEYVVEESPSCSDGILNQDESEIDCGGSCSACVAEEKKSSSGGSSWGSPVILSCDDGFHFVSDTNKTCVEDESLILSSDLSKDNVAINEESDSGDLNSVVTGNVVNLGDGVSTWKSVLFLVVLFGIVGYFVMKKK